MKSSRLFMLLLVSATAVVGLFLAVHRYSPADNLPMPQSKVADTPSVQPPQTSPQNDAPPAPTHKKSSSGFSDPMQKNLSVPARLVITSNWKNESDPKLKAFSSWTDRFLNADEVERSNLLAEGKDLAQQRREVFKQLIRDDPEQALASAVPLAVREQLPPEIVSLLENRVSGRGELSLNAALPAPGRTMGESYFRSALVDGHEYQAFTYGRREQLATLPDTSINGVAVDKLIAVSDSPLRVLEPGEKAGKRKINDVCPISGKTTPTTADQPLNQTEQTAAEVNGNVFVFCDPAHVAAYEIQLEASEQKHQENGADGQSGTSGVTGRPTSSWTHGFKSVLIIRVNFPDLPGTPVNPSDGQAITEDYVVNLFNKTNGVRDFYEKGSYGETSVQISPTVAGDSPDVTAVLLMPSNSVIYATNGDNSSLHKNARDAAELAGYNVSSYDRVGVVFANLGSIPGSKITYAGLGNIIGNNFWINGYYNFNVVAHEIGHNYGLNHADLWQVTNSNPISLTGTSLDYGDIFDIMGSGTAFENDFSHWNKSILQWIPDTAVTTITNSGTYRVFKFDDPDANLTNALALKIVRDSTRDYWIGHRRATTNPNLDNGAYVIWGYNINKRGDLLDLTTPGNNVNDAPLEIGATFTDTNAGITLHTTARGGSGADEWLDVEVTLQPRIQWANTSVYADEGSGTATLTLTRNNNSSGAVSVNFSTIPGTATSPSDYTTTNGTVSWANGDSSPKSISIPIVNDGTPEGTEQFTVRLSNPSGAVVVDNSNATVFVTEPGTYDPEFAPTFINNAVERIAALPDGEVIAAGWFSQVYDKNFQSYVRNGIARFTANGDLDTNFPSDGTGITGPSSPHVEDMARQPDNKILIVGNFTAVNGTARNYIARLNSDGSVDSSFNPGTGANDTVRAVLAQTDGKILIGGDFTSFNGTPREYLARLNADGSLDTSFTGPDFAASSGWGVETLALQTDGKILVGGVFYFATGNQRAGLVRLTTNGALDSTFNGVNQGAHLAGNTSFLERVHRIVPLSSGGILIAGDFTAFNNVARGGIALLTSTGALDNSFAPTTDGSCYTILVQPDGKYLVGGSFSTVNGSPAQSFVRLTSTGASDTTFPAANGPSGGILDFALQPDGRILFGSSYGTFQTHAGPLWRFFSGIPALPGTIQWNSDVAFGIEGTNAVLTATRVGGSAGALSVNFSTVTNSASTADFTSTNGTLSWANGDSTARTITIPITSDAAAEGPETFMVNLGVPVTGCTLLGDIRQVLVSIYTGFGAWQATNFTTLQLANPLISGDAADPDGDRIKNILEYAFGFSPNVPNTNGLPKAGLQNVSGTNYLTLNFRRRVPPLDLNYTPRMAGSLTGAWNTGAIQVGSPVNNGDGTESVTFRDTVSVTSTNQRFMRVDVGRTP